MRVLSITKEEAIQNVLLRLLEHYPDQKKELWYRTVSVGATNIISAGDPNAQLPPDNIELKDCIILEIAGASYFLHCLVTPQLYAILSENQNIKTYGRIK